MSTFILGIILTAFSQLPQLPADDAKIYRIIFEDGTERYGAVEESGVQLKIYYDTPWAPQPPETVLKRRVKWEELSSALRKSRQKEEAGRMGYELWRTEHGESWVQRHELDMADRAKEMLRSIEEEQAEALAAAAPLASTRVGNAVSTNSEPGMLQQYALHALIALVGLVLCGVTLRALVLTE